MTSYQFASKPEKQKPLERINIIPTQKVNIDDLDLDQKKKKRH
jgi:hypothetical protein